MYLCRPHNEKKQPKNCEASSQIGSSRYKKERPRMRNIQENIDKKADFYILVEIKKLA